MIHWTDHGSVLSADAFPYAQPNGAWAAQFVESDGKFYYYVTLDRKDKPEHAIDVAVGDSPLCPFVPARNCRSTLAITLQTGKASAAGTLVDEINDIYAEFDMVGREKTQDLRTICKIAYRSLLFTNI